MVPKALAALHEPEIAHQAIGAAAHPNQPRAVKAGASKAGALEVGFNTRQHATSMHYPAIPSNLDLRESAAFRGSPAPPIELFPAARRKPSSIEKQFKNPLNL